MGLIKERMKSGEECCKLANERFGLQQALRIILEDNFNCNDVAVDYIIKLAQNRELHKLKGFMEHVGTNDSDKPRHTRIRTPSSVNGMY
tara:strand:- start:44 stop:310 length:267 start_codon:yes stop_codon:yes gene_type:complete